MTKIEAIEALKEELDLLGKQYEKIGEIEDTLSNNLATLRGSLLSVDKPHEIAVILDSIVRVQSHIKGVQSIRETIQDRLIRVHASLLEGALRDDNYL
jgi:hypothetical protein